MTNPLCAACDTPVEPTGEAKYPYEGMASAVTGDWLFTGPSPVHEACLGKRGTENPTWKSLLEDGSIRVSVEYRTAAAFLGGNYWGVWGSSAMVPRTTLLDEDRLPGGQDLPFLVVQAHTARFTEAQVAFFDIEGALLRALSNDRYSGILKLEEGTALAYQAKRAKYDAEQALTFI